MSSTIVMLCSSVLDYLKGLNLILLIKKLSGICLQKMVVKASCPIFSSMSSFQLSMRMLVFDIHSLKIYLVGEASGISRSEYTMSEMHQYHFGTEEDEKDGKYVISKVLFQHQREKSEQDVTECSDMTVAKVDPVTPKSVTPDPPRNERLASNDLSVEVKNVDAEVEVALGIEVPPEVEMALDVEDPPEVAMALGVEVPTEVEVALDVDVPPDVEVAPEVEVVQADCDLQFIDESDRHENVDDIDNHIQDYPKWWDSESQNLLDSQQLVEGVSLCDEVLASQSPERNGSTDDENLKSRSHLSDYAHLGPEDLKKDLEECQKLVLDPANIDLDTPPEFRLSQLEFGSQDSYLAWGVGKMGD